MSTGQKIFCSRCGAEMNINQRNCLKCGQLNFQNPANKYMEKYETKEDKSQVYVIGEGGFGSGSRASERLTDKMGDVRICSLVNILLYLLGVLVIFFIDFSGGNVLDFMVQSNFSILLIAYSLSFIFFYSLQVLFMKANHPWWSAIIPGYNIFVLVEIVFSNGWYFLFLFIPVVNLVFALLLAYNLGKVFDKNKVLTLLFFPIMIFVIAFDSVSKYNGTIYVSRKNGHNASVILYKWNRLVLRLILLVVSFSAIIFVYKNIDVFVGLYNRIKTRSFIRDANNIMNDFKDSLELCMQ